MIFENTGMLNMTLLNAYYSKKYYYTPRHEVNILKMISNLNEFNLLKHYFKRGIIVSHRILWKCDQEKKA